jgi:hypothetical protein
VVVAARGALFLTRTVKVSPQGGGVSVMGIRFHCLSCGVDMPVASGESPISWQCPECGAEVQQVLVALDGDALDLGE